MEKILKKANELGHLLKKNETVNRYLELLQNLEKDEVSRKLLEDLIAASQAYEMKTREGGAIEVEEKNKISDLQDQAKENALISEFLATQAYYMNIMGQVNEALSNPKGEPPKDSKIILPDDDDKKIIL